MQNTLIDASLSHPWLEELNSVQQTKSRSFQPQIPEQFNFDLSDTSLATKSFFQPLIAEGVHTFIDNLQGQLALLYAGKHVLPLLITDKNYQNTYICSPYGHFVQLPLESLSIINNIFLKKSAALFIKLYGKLLKFGEINKVVYVNHWLFSTDLYPKEFNGKEIKSITETLVKQFPRHAIVFRSINATTNPDLKAELEKCNYHPLPSRQIFISKPYDSQVLETRIIKSDLKLFKEMPYEFFEGSKLNLSDLLKILELHNNLSEHHQTTLNPKINLKFLQSMIAGNAMKLSALKQENVVIGFVGYFEQGDTMVCPLFGFDKTHEDKSKIYRILSTFLFQEARKNNLKFNQSAGASFYKSLRKAIPEIEYMYFYDDHLSSKQKLIWRILKGIIQTFAIPFMKKY